VKFLIYLDEFKAERAMGFLVPSRLLEKTVKKYIPETAVYTYWKGEYKHTDTDRNSLSPCN
jgi:hypothetical protein